MKNFSENLGKKQKRYFLITGIIALAGLFHLVISPLILSLFGLQWRSRVDCAAILVTAVSCMLIVIGIGVRYFVPIKGRIYMIFANLLLGILFLWLCVSIYIVAMLGIAFHQTSESVIWKNGQQYVHVTADLGGEQNKLYRYYGPFVMSKDWSQGPAKESSF